MSTVERSSSELNSSLISARRLDATSIGLQVPEVENFKGYLHLEALDNLVNIAEKILHDLQAHIDEDVVEKSVEFSEKSVGEFRESKQELGVARLELFSLADRTGKILVGGDLKSSLRRISAEYSLIKLEGVSQSYRLAINTFRQTERQIRDLERFLYELSKFMAATSTG